MLLKETLPKYFHLVIEKNGERLSTQAFVELLVDDFSTRMCFLFGQKVATIPNETGQHTGEQV